VPLRGGGGPGIPSGGSLTLSGDVTGTDSATVVSAISGASPIVITPAVLQWAATTVGPTLTQAAAASDVATQPLTITPQAPFSGATVNKNSGPFILNFPAPISGGLYGLSKIQFGGTDCVTIGTYAGVTGGSTAYGSIWFMDAGSATTTNFGFLGNQTISYLNNPVQVSLSIGGSSGTGLDLTAATALWHPPTLSWLSAVTSPTFTQAALASTSAGAGAAGQPMTYSAQAGQAATGGTNAGGAGGILTLAPGQGGTSGGGQAGSPGAVVVALPTPAAGANESALQLTRGGQLWGSIQPLFGTPASGALYLAGNAAALVPSATNFTIANNLNSGLLQINSAGAGQIQLQVGNAVYQALTASLIQFAKPVGGYSTTPLSFSGQTSPNTVAGGVGGTQTISAAQAIIPFFLITTGTLTSNVVVDFSTNASTGFFIVDLSGVGTLGAFTLGFKNGTTTKTITATQLTNLIATGASAATIVTYGSNNITIVV
jgi:hypothetical protein